MIQPRRARRLLEEAVVPVRLSAASGPVRAVGEVAAGIVRGKRSAIEPTGTGRSAFQ
jgi:hypothetical protein